MSNFSFSSVPTIRHSRSRFDLSHGVKTSGNVGTLYPFDVQEVYAGDTFKVKTSAVSRLSSQFIRPVMDNLFMDVYYFFVPSRILYDKFPNIFGENTESAWANTVDYDVPTTSGYVRSGSVGDYLGLPVGMRLEEVSLLPFRAFAKIYDDWFRDENNIPPMHIQTGDATGESLSGIPTGIPSAWAPNNYVNAYPPPVAKLHDYFTSALPAPQKGNAVDIPLSGFSDVPVSTWENQLDANGQTLPMWGQGLSSTGTSAARNSMMYFGEALDGSTKFGNDYVGYEAADGPLVTEGTARGFYPTNLYAMTSELSSTGFTVNDLRFAFQYQKMLERDARSGTRFVEYLQAHFGVSPGDYRLQRSEFLGGKRSPISIHQVTQTTGSGSETSPLGEVGAYSLSNSFSRYTKGFTENGYVIGVFCIRQFHTYQQGIEKFWLRKKRTDFFDPVFSNIGEQPIWTRELYGSAPSDQVFGYGEAWADLRYKPSHITGQLRTGVSNSLDVWHFGDYYQGPPTLTPGFINETPEYVNRAITVESGTLNQFIIDFYINNIAYRPLPTYSVPSLIDHN